MRHVFDDLRQTPVPEGAIRLYWLGQAGFAFRTAAGKRIFLDPYLSDSCERLFGFKRLSLPALRPEEVEADWVILTHEHADHLDPDAIPVIARNNPNCRFAIPCHFWTLAEQGGGRSRRLPQCLRRDVPRRQGHAARAGRRFHNRTEERTIGAVSWAR